MGASSSESQASADVEVDGPAPVEALEPATAPQPGEMRRGGVRPGAWEGPVEERGAGGWRRVVGGGRRAAGRLGRPVVGRNGRDRVEDLVEADESSGEERGIAGWVRSIMSGATQCRPPSSGGRASSALRRDPELVTPTRSGSLMMKARDPLEESEALEEREVLEELLTPQYVTPLSPCSRLPSRFGAGIVRAWRVH